jgi:acetyl esterase/lipase
LFLWFSKHSKQRAGDFKTPVKLGFTTEDIAGLRCYWLNEANRDRGVLIYLPGGGFVTGPTRAHWYHCLRMGRRLRYAVLLISYPLAPEHPFPAALNGITAVIQALQHQNRLPENWLISGDSAGGNLALTTTLTLQKRGAALPKKLVLLSPSVNMNRLEYERTPPDPMLSADYRTYVDQSYVQQSDPTNPLLSPLFADLSGLPPMLIQMGTHDILIHEVRKLVQRMQTGAQPVQFDEYSDMMHVFMLFWWLPEARQAIRGQVAFITGSSGKESQ